MLAKQTCCGNAAWVERCECDSGILVITTVEFLHCKHVAHLAVLVRLGAVKIAAVNHGGAVQSVEASGETSQVTQIGLRRHIACQCVRVTCSRREGGVINMQIVAKYQ